MIISLRARLLLLLVFVCVSSSAQQLFKDSHCEAPDHNLWSDLLTEHVDSLGWVSYQGFVADSARLNEYLTALSLCPPNSNWTDNETLAYWINVYNAFTVKLIVDHYPITSIKEIKKGIPFVNSVWDIKFFEIGGRKMDLNEVEHSILRKQFKEPRIHFAIVCASVSCPRLLNQAYQPEMLYTQLKLQTKNFIDDYQKNEIGADQIRISPIFKWFAGDFTQNGSIQEFIKPYSSRDLKKTAKVRYLEYDWSLNGE